MSMINLLAISGSVRAASLNSKPLRALQRLAPSGLHIGIYAGIRDLSLFNPDLEELDPAAVAESRSKLVAADGVIIADPEYPHGIPRAMKNALDWVVASEALVYKPVMLLNASPRATHAQAALREVLGVMSACIVDDASIAVPILGSGLTEGGIVEHVDISTALRKALSVFQEA